jgi:hypothetical protein
LFENFEFLRGRGGEKIGEMVFGKLSQGTGVAGNFGLGGQETARIPGAREPERLFLVGWEVNIQSGQEQEHDQIEKGLDNQPEGGGMYYNVVFIILLILLCCYH